MRPQNNHHRRHLPFFVLYLGLDIVNSIGRFHLKGDSLAGESLNKNLHGDWSDWNGEEFGMKQQRSYGWVFMYCRRFKSGLPC